jgi:hypothetical protein
MKVNKNTLYSVKKFFVGKLIEEGTISNQDFIKEKVLTQNQVDNLISILENNVLNMNHRCISVYRHAFISGENTYNVCVGCGDFFKNNEYFCLTSKGVEEFKKAIEC